MAGRYRRLKDKGSHILQIHTFNRESRCPRISAAGKIRNVNIVYIADEAEPHRESDPPNIIVTDFLKQGSQLLEMLLLSRACSIRHAWGFATDLLQVLFRDAYRLHDDSSPEIKDLPQQPH